MTEGMTSLEHSNVSAPGPLRASAPSRQGTGSSATRQHDGTATETAESLSAGEVMAAVTQVNKTLQQMDGTFSVSVDDDSGMVVVRITDSETGELVKQIPPQQLLDANVSVEKIIGLLVNDQA